MAFIGLDLGGTKLSGAVVNENGSMSDYTSLPLEKRTGSEVGELIVSLIDQLTEKASLRNIVTEGIGCCVPGIAYKDTGKVWAPNIPGWDDFALEDLIKQHLQGKNIRVVIDNDRACSIMGEIWQGAAKGCRNAIFMAVGTGIGAGIVSDGHIIRGKSDIAGAIGWLVLNQLFHEKYIPVGYFEYHASGDGLAKVAREYLLNEKSYNGILRHVSLPEISAYHIFNACEAGDSLASKIIEQAIIYWGMAVANLVSIFNPEKIIFGGGVFGPAVRYLDEIKKEALKWAQPISMRQVSLIPSTLGKDAGLIGSAWLAIEAAKIIGE